MFFYGLLAKICELVIRFALKQSQVMLKKLTFARGLMLDR